MDKQTNRPRACVVIAAFTAPFLEGCYQTVAVEPVLRLGPRRGDEGLQGVERRFSAHFPRGSEDGRGHRGVLRTREARRRLRFRRKGSCARPRLLSRRRDRWGCPLRCRRAVGGQGDDRH
ncbi:hypothetical protein TNCV_504391 [Trichonephila clavipes]|nr:hypothetical protein TNCV_504391 [Trichonephila clavipes]